MENVVKPACEYGANCYRKNPNHFKEYSHPQDKAKEAKEKIDKREPVLKKPKLDIVKERVERIKIKEEPVKTPESTKKLKQTTLDFFRKGGKAPVKSPEGIRKSPRKHGLGNKNEGSEDKTKTLASPKKDNIGNKKIKNSPNLMKEKTVVKKKPLEIKVKSPETAKTRVDYLSDSDEGTEKIQPDAALKKKSPQKNIKSPKKQESRTKVDYISDSDEEIPESQVQNEPAKDEGIIFMEKKSPGKLEAKKPESKHDCVSESDDETTNLSKKNIETENLVGEGEKKSSRKNDSDVEKIETLKNISESSQKNEEVGKKIIEESDNEEDDEEGAPAQSWTYIKKSPEKLTKETVKNKNLGTREDIIKNVFLVDMPRDFYIFFDFCKSLDSAQPLKALQNCELRLVGPFDILAGSKQLIEKNDAVCHWRYYYDPPEFQTVLSGENGFHLGYWRDDPKELPVFVASNNAEKDCVFKIEAENIFGAVNSYLNDYGKTCDPFKKTKIPKLQSQLGEWTEKNKITLEKMTDSMKKRQKKVVSKTLHRAGIVVPVEPKTELGYRPLIETEANLKKICKLIMNSKDSEERDALWDNLQPLITAANIANDECDFGNALELGIDLFCMGSPVFHDTISHLLSTSYSLLRRNEFAEIIQKHLKNRRKGFNLSVI